MTAGPREGERDAFIRRSLVARLLNDQSIAELANLPLGALAIALTWGSVPLRAQLIWFAILATATFVRMFIRKRVAVSDIERGIPKRLRAAVILVAVVWGVGVVTLAPYTPPVEVALVLLIVCGLTAAATSTLLADPVAYAGYNVVMLGFTALAALRLSADSAFRVAFVIVILYGGVMASLYSRLRRVLMQSLDNEYGVRIASASAERERAFLDKLIESAPNAILVVNPDSRVKRANSAFERLFGFTVEEVGDRPLGDLIVPPNDRAEADAVGRTLEAGRTVEFEAQRVRKDGVAIDVRVSATRMDGENGGTLVMYDDITKRKAAERALRDSEARLFRTLASLPVGILVVDAEGTPYFANDVARRLLGQGVAASDPGERAAGTHATFIAGTRTPYPKERRPVHRALSGENSNVDDLEVEGPFGSAVLEAFGSPIRDEHGKVMFGVAAFTDITERRRISEELNRARIAAEQSTAAKSAFLANMSHEIRTPLNGILGMAELVLDADLSPEDRKSVELIMQSGELLLHVINDILDFSKIEAGQLEIEATEVDVERLVGSTVRLLMPSAVRRGFEIVTEVRPGVPPCVLADPTRVRQVLTNLVGNAVKFTHEGEVAVVVERVDDDTTPSGHARLRFSVRDTGVGIAPEKLATIFEAFRQADTTTTRRYGGTGLGLSISRRLVELMGGQLDASSVAGGGSTFSFALTLPIAEPRIPAPPPSVRLEGLRVLVVDDNATNRRVITGMLHSAHCVVFEASDADAGLEMLRASAQEGREIDIVISDLMMPGTNGFDFTRAIRSDPSVAGARVIVASSLNRRGDAAVSRELGIAAYLLKPVSRIELLDAMKGAIHETPVASMRAVKPVRSQAALAEPLRVLLAEDNAVNQEVAAAVLRRRGHRVTIVSTGRAAVDAAAAGEYDVVLMDLQMPELDGFEATAEIRKLPSARKLHIIALTANAMTGERERCIAAGMDDYVAKPFKAADLLDAVERFERRSSAPIADAEGPAVDLEGFRESLESGGVGALYGQLIALFLSDSPSRVDAIRVAAAAGDPKQLERAAHALKSGAATLRASRLAALLGDLEASARDGEADRLPALVNDVQSAYAEVLRVLREAGHA